MGSRTWSEKTHLVPCVQDSLGLNWVAREERSLVDRKGGDKEWLACVLRSGGGRSSSATGRKRGEDFELRPRPAVYLFSVHSASRLGQQCEGKRPRVFCGSCSASGFLLLSLPWNLDGHVIGPDPDLSLPKGGRSLFIVHSLPTHVSWYWALLEGSV